MAERDEEVERVLLEIRQRLSVGAGEGEDGERERERVELARIEVSLGAAERARDRLPPVSSDRSGWLARLEVWTKRQLQRATNWFTWEQINFNSAVVDALSSARALLAAQGAREVELRQRLDALERELRALKPAVIEPEGAQRAARDAEMP
jgi:hypothetical protein